MRAILRENGIAVDEIAVPYRHPVISIPILPKLTALSLHEGTSLNLAQDISMNVKEYEYEYIRNNTLFYELRKERKKMSKCDCDTACCEGCSCATKQPDIKYCGCNCKGKSKEHSCRCNSTCSCGCGQTYWGEKADKYALLGFTENSMVPKVINSYTGGFLDEAQPEELILRLAEREVDKYSSFTMIVFDANRRVLFCKNICLERPTKSVAKLC
jgi:hypothetical protein